MRLDFNPANRMFVLFVDRNDKQFDVPTLMRDYGLHFSAPASMGQEVCLFTPLTYAAATFLPWATDAARAELAWIGREIEASRKASSGRHFDVPHAVIEAGLDLWDFQKADLEYMLKRDRSLDADEPGLGKTNTAIVFANEIKAKRVLVICPASIRFQWLRKIVGNAEEPGWSNMGDGTEGTYKVPNRMAYAVTSGHNGVHPTAGWTVVSYDLARSKGILEALRQTDYDLLILDEAHYLKTVGSKRTRAVFGGGDDPLYHEALADRAERVVALTGTPLPNRPREAYVLARHLDHASIDFLSEDRFTEAFNPIAVREVTRTREDGSRYSIVVSDEKSGRHAELQNRLRAHFMTRHLKREVMTQLKYPVYELVRMAETKAIRAALRAESLLGIDPEAIETGHIDPSEIGHIAEARRIMGEAMAPSVAAYVADLIDGGEEKLTLFYWHISVGNILQHHLARYGVCRVDGSTSPLVKDTLVQEYQRNPHKRVMMGNLLSLGTGTDGLQHVCYHGIIAEPSWVPGENVQAFDRLDRGGQKMLVQGDICVASGSLSERILASALRKMRVSHNALDRRVA